MKKKSADERRKYPRFEHRFPIKVAVDGYDFITVTQNVSCVGVYCHINKYMPPFTKVMVRLILPVMTEKGRKDYEVQCKGVVVRTDDEEEGGFNIAVFFNEMNEDQRRKISQYINQFSPPKRPILLKGNVRR